MDDIYKNIEEYNPNKNAFIVFDNIIANMLNNKKHSLIVTELFIRVRKLNISLVFVTQYYFALSRDIRLNSTDCFIMEISNKRELHENEFNRSLGK